MMTTRNFILCLALVGATGVASAKEEPVMMKVAGIDVIVRQNTANAVIAADLFIKGGRGAVPKSESVALEGMTLSVASSSGSTKYSKDDYQRKLAAMVSSIDGGSGDDYSSMSMRCVREHFNETWNLFADVITAPLFDSVEIMKDKRNSITAIKSIKTRPDSYDAFLCDSMYFAGHPYSRRPTIEEVEAITPADLQKYYAEQMVKARLLLVVVGNVTPEEVKKEVEASLASLPEGSYTPPALPAIEGGKHAAIADKRIPTTYILGYFAAPNRRQSDYWAMVMAVATLNDRLFEEVRTKRNLSYAPGAGLKPDETCAGVISVSTTLPDSTMRVIYRCIDSLKSTPMGKKEITSQVAGFLTAIYMREETNASQCEALGRYQLTTGDWRNAMHVVEQFQKVTPADVQNVAKKYMHDFTFAAVGKAENITKSLLESE